MSCALGNLAKKEENNSQIHFTTVQVQTGQDHTGTANRIRTLLELEPRKHSPFGEEDEQIAGVGCAIGMAEGIRH
ncbi:MAG: hypothetical protein IH984_12370 [Planctomycetes bacterium]|nr:hypothetical protein [Planctomycetota bacterium]